MDEQEAREQVRPLGNVERLAPGEEAERRSVLDLLYPLDPLDPLDEIKELAGGSTYTRFVLGEGIAGVILHIKALIDQWERGIADPGDVVREIRTTLKEEGL